MQNESSRTPLPPDVVPLTVPDVGAGDGPLTVSSWFADEGESVSVGDTVVVLLVPGITCDVASPVSGVVVRVEKQIDARVRVGDVLGWIVREGETVEGAVD